MPTHNWALERLYAPAFNPHKEQENNEQTARAIMCDTPKCSFNTEIYGEYTLSIHLLTRMVLVIECKVTTLLSWSAHVMIKAKRQCRCSQRHGPATLQTQVLAGQWAAPNNSYMQLVHATSWRTSYKCLYYSTNQYTVRCMQCYREALPCYRN